MEKKENFQSYFSSNGHLLWTLKEWYFTTQCLHIRKLTDAKDDPCSLMSLLLKVKNNKDNIDRGLFCCFHNNDSYCDIAFDTLSGSQKENRKCQDRISEEYLDSLMSRLKVNVIQEVRNYVDRIVAHSDFKQPEIYPSMHNIKECHKILIGVYKEVELNFFLADSAFGEPNIYKEQVLINADKPFITFAGK